jgi:hypothetical protein
MSRFAITAAILSAAVLFSGAAQAMEIRQFDKMADADQSEYIGNLIVGTENAVADEGRPEVAAQVNYLFTTKDTGDADVIGMVEFERNLALTRVADAERAEKDPSAHRIAAEDAAGCAGSYGCNYRVGTIGEVRAVGA